MTSRLTRVAAVLGASALWAACSKADNKADSTAAADSAAKASAAAAAPAAPTPAAPAALTDANIVAILDGANAADSSAGAVAATKGTGAQVKAFGKDMMRDHHALRKAGADLAKKLNVTPEMPGGDTTQAAAQKWQDNLNSTAAGTDWDKAYVDHEVSYHQSVLATAQAAEGAAQNAELKALIKKAEPNIEAHLKHAQSIQAKLNGAKP